MAINVRWTEENVFPSIFCRRFRFYLFLYIENVTDGMQGCVEYENETENAKERRKKW